MLAWRESAYHSAATSLIEGDLSVILAVRTVRGTSGRSEKGWKNEERLALVAIFSVLEFFSRC